MPAESRRWIPSRRYKRAPRPGISCAEAQGAEIPDDQSQCIFSSGAPDPDITKVMFSICIKVGIIAILTLNVYKFWGKIRIQTGHRGPTGEMIVMACSRVVMNNWG